MLSVAGVGTTLTRRLTVAMTFSTRSGWSGSLVNTRMSREQGPGLSSPFLADSLIAHFDFCPPSRRKRLFRQLGHRTGALAWSRGEPQRRLAFVADEEGVFYLGGRLNHAGMVSRLVDHGFWPGGGVAWPEGHRGYGAARAKHGQRNRPDHYRRAEGHQPGSRQYASRNSHRLAPNQVDYPKRPVM